MRQMAIIFGLTFAFGIALGVISSQFLNAQQPSIKRTEILKADMAGMEGMVAHMWIAEVAPGSATGKHSHPTPRFVYVMEGSVILEVEGKPPQTFKAGEGFQEMPDTVHNFRNASVAEPAKALGFQIVAKRQPLQY